MAEIRVEKKKKGIPLIWILLTLIVLALVVWALFEWATPEQDEVTVVPAVEQLAVPPQAHLPEPPAEPSRKPATRPGNDG